MVGEVDISDPAAVGPPELFVWVRFPGAEAQGVVGQALLAYATDGFLIGTAMRPHEGVGQALSHVSISTSVLSHTLTFHEPVDAGAVAPAGAREPVRRPRPLLRPGQHLQRRRPGGGLVRAGQHDPRLPRGPAAQGRGALALLSLPGVHRPGGPPTRWAPTRWTQATLVTSRQPQVFPPPAPTATTSGRRATWRSPPSPRSWTHASCKKP